MLSKDEKNGAGLKLLVKKQQSLLVEGRREYVVRSVLCIVFLFLPVLRHMIEGS